MNRRLLLGSIALTAVGVAGCSGSGGNIAEPEDVPASTPLDAADDPDFVRNQPESASSASVETAVSTTEFDVAAQPTTPAIEVVPETGVPGIDSADAFCRAWSEFAGSFQAVGLASAIGDPDNAIRTEVFAAPAVVDAVLALEANLPPELEAERVALVADFAGPYFARASAAESLLDKDVRDDIAAAWITQLTDAGVDDPFFVIDLPVTVEPVLFAGATEVFASSFPPVVDDPSLITDVQIPLTEAYLEANCPDGGVLSGNDVIADG